MPENITIDDIADAANVSTATVSRILNNKPDVSEATRARVLAIIRELGYTPHVSARSLAAGKGHMIAMLYPFHDPEFSQPELGFFTSAALMARERGFFVNLITDLFDENGLLNASRSAQMDGIILTQVHMQDWRVNLLRESGHPFVMIGRDENNEGLNFVDLDSEASILLAFRYLVELGHRHIGFINFPLEPRLDRCGQYGPSVRSEQGFERARREYPIVSVVTHAQPSIEALYQGTVELVHALPSLTAIVTRHAAAAVGILRALHDLGKQVPGDCSVIGIMPDAVADLLTPPLTTIHFPAIKLGREAARILIHQLESKRPLPAEQILIAPELMERGSTQRLN